MSRSKLVNFSINHPRLVIIIATLITIVFALQIPKAIIDTDPENMLDADEPVRVTHSRIKNDFNLSDFLVVGFSNDEQPVLTPEFEEKLSALVGLIEEMEGVVVDDIMAPSTVDEIYQNAEGALVVARLNKPRKNIVGVEPPLAERINENPVLAGKLASRDGKTVALYIPLEEKSYAHAVSEAIKADIDSLGGFPIPHIAGLPVAEDTFGQQMFVQMGISAPMAGALIFILLWFFFRKVKVVLAPMIVAMMTIGWTMGLLVTLGYTLHIMSSMIAIFLMPIAVLDSVHILSEFHDRYQETRSRRQAIIATMDDLYGPMLFTSLTTLVGFASLMLADIPPVKVFGAFVAFGVGVAWFLSMTVNPAYAVLVSKKTLETFGQSSDEGTLLARVLPRLGEWTLRRRVVIVGASFVVLGVAMVGISKIVVNDNPIRWFKYDNPVRVAERTLKKRLAGTYMTYFEFDATKTESGSVKNAATLNYMQELQKHLDSLPNVGSTTGVTDIIKKVRFELHSRDSAMYAIPESADEIAQELFLYEISGGDPEDLYKFITPEGDRALVWLQLREGDNRAVSEVITAAEDYVAMNPAPAGMSFDWAGLSYINVIWQEKIVKGMLEALLGSFIVVALMMILLLRSVSLGLISMIPLSVTIALVYGIVGFSGKQYDMPIAVLSSLTLGLSIDFAIHFLKRGQDIYQRLGDAQATLRELFGEPSRAIARNIVIISLGFTPLLTSSLVPYITVGAFFLAIMGISGVGALIILPALVRLRGDRAFETWGNRKSVKRAIDVAEKTT
jgi:uncharacterized protein